eukprot:scaffold604_cov384-Prasinococcus_capsulatus_cf.AAC.43
MSKAPGGIPCQRRPSQLPNSSVALRVGSPRGSCSCVWQATLGWTEERTASGRLARPGRGRAEPG